MFEGFMAEMDSEQRFLELVKPGSEVEASWLKNLFTFINRQVCPLLTGPALSAADQLLTVGHAGGHCVERPGVQGDMSVSLSVCVVKMLQENSNTPRTLPVSYIPVSVSELVSQQHLACVSHLSWTTNKQRVWAREAELFLPGSKALPRVNLLLIGWLREGRGGEWKLTDVGGSVRCEFISPSPHWVNHPVFLPHWNYIPQKALGQEEPGGFVEVIGPPVLLCPGPEQRLAAGSGGGVWPSKPVGVREAGVLLHNRVRGQRVSVWGRVSSVCPLLVVAGTSFFCFTLTEDQHAVPVLVKESSRLWWLQCVCVGQSVCVTVLRVCVLRGWERNNILCVTDQSEIHTNYTSAHEPVDDAHGDFQSDTPPPMMSQADSEHTCEEPESDVIQSGARMKRGRVISYQGTVTEVVSQGAGLFVLDKKVCLCLAYQPSLRRNLRQGDCVELHNVHFLYRPCPDLPPSMLCACLRSSLRVTSFSRVGLPPPDSTCPDDGALPRLLLEKNLGVSEYLWACHLSSQLSHSLVPSVLKQQQCVCVLSWKLIELVWGHGGRGRRDIYSEMLSQPHTCPLSQYSVDPAVPQSLSISDVVQSSQRDSWSTLSLSSLLSHGGSCLSRAEINTALSWSFRIQSSVLQSCPQTSETPGRRPLLVVGLLELASETSENKHTLQLRDASAAVACVLTETEDEGAGQGAAHNTAWIGCLVCVHHFTMVTERFLKSDFPSHQHLDQDQFITHKHCRVYLQFSLDHVYVLSPSVAMVTHLRQRGVGSCDDVTDRKQPEERRKRKRIAEGSDSTHPAVAMTTSPSCVSMVLVAERKEGVVWKNVGAGLKEELVLNFTVRAAVIGPVVSWERDPKNSPMTDRESEREKEEKVVLVFSGVCVRWFPLLQPGCFYRLVAANTQDPRVFIGCDVSGQKGVELHNDSTLQVRSDWKFHTLKRPLLLHTCRRAISPTVLSVSEVLDCSLELVCFQGLVTDRISANRTSRCGHTGMRLTVCDQSGRSLHVYLALDHTPYPPGLLPGNTLLLSAFQRRLSRSGGVYCSDLPVSSITVVSLGDKRSAQPPPAPMMHLGLWSLNRERTCTVCQVKGHIVCFLFLQLQWSCSLCTSLYTHSCSRSQCRSTSSVFQSKAKLVIDDGTAEAHVWFSGVLVQPLLGFTDSQWEGLQRALRVRGHIGVYPRGRSLVCDDSEDFLLHFLLGVCSSDAACRSLSLTCRKNNRQKAEETKTFSRGDRDFLTRMTPPLQLTCLSVS